MIILELPPEQDSYSVEDSSEVVTRTQLDGGAGRYRRVLFGTSSLVTCTWICNADEYDYLKAFYRQVSEGADSFLTNLIIDSADLVEYECHFIPKSFKLVAVKGLSYTVSATLEATPYDGDNDERDEAIIFLYGYFREDYSKIAIATFDKLDPHVNIILPHILS